MLIIRLNQLAAGGSGANPVVLDGLAAMIAADALPTIREHGGIGTGDLSALATTALALMGEGPTSAPLPAISPFTAHDALPFMSSNAATLADAALAYVDLAETVRAALVVAALTFAAIGGNGEAFSAAVDRVTPFAGARQVNAWLRALIASDAVPARIQDPFGLRVLPQAQGAALDSLRTLSDTVFQLANAPSENPVLLGDEPADAALAHHGGFHASYLQMALDTAVLGVAQTGQLVLGRLAALIEPSFTGLAPFLGDGTAGASGVMILEYVAASALGELRAAATPAGLQSVTLSRAVEEDASFASLAGRQALTAAENYRTLVACELVAAVRALRMQSRPVPSGLQSVLAQCEDLAAATVDRDLTPDIQTATALLPALAQTLGE
jgi:histidine ammonia-lyase